MGKYCECCDYASHEFKMEDNGSPLSLRECIHCSFWETDFQKYSICGEYKQKSKNDYLMIWEL